MRSKGWQTTEDMPMEETIIEEVTNGMLEMRGYEVMGVEANAQSRTGSQEEKKSERKERSKAGRARSVRSRRGWGWGWGW